MEHVKDQLYKQQQDVGFYGIRISYYRPQAVARICLLRELP